MRLAEDAREVNEDPRTYDWIDEGNLGFLHRPLDVLYTQRGSEGQCTSSVWIKDGQTGSSRSMVLAWGFARPGGVWGIHRKYTALF